MKTVEDKEEKALWQLCNKIEIKSRVSTLLIKKNPVHKLRKHVLLTLSAETLDDRLPDFFQPFC